MGICTCLTSGEQKCGKTKFKAIDYCRNRAYSTNLKIFTRCQHGDEESVRKMSLRSVAHSPGQRQGATFIDDMDHLRAPPAAPAAAIHDEHHRLQSEMTQQDIRIGQKVYPSRRWALSHHRAKRLTRLSGLVPARTFMAMWGSWVLLLPTMPLRSAARVLRGRAKFPRDAVG